MGYTLIKLFGFTIVDRQVISVAELMYTFLELGGFTIELAKLILCMIVFLKYQLKENSKYSLPLITALSYGLLIVGTRRDTSADFFELLSFLMVLVISWIVFRGKLIRRITISTICYIAISTIDTMIRLLVTRAPQISPDTFYSNQVGLIFSDSISLIIILGILIVQKKFKKSISIPLRQLHWSYYILLFWTLLCFVLLISFIQFIEINSGTKESLFLIIILAVSTIGVMMIVVLISRISYSRDNYKALSQMNQEYLKVQQQYYVLLSDKNEDIRRFQHDIKNHFLCMQALSQEDKTNELKNYINGLTKNFKEISYKITTGNNIVDAILSDTLMTRTDLNIVVDGRLPYPLHISAMDLCTIVSNILTNAVEAVSKIDDPTNKLIHFDIKNLENNIYLKVTNAVREKVIIQDNTVKTTKCDGKLHGFGLGNIRKCVEKYQGSIDLKSTEDEFILEILMKNEDVDRLRKKNDRIQK